MSVPEQVAPPVEEVAEAPVLRSGYLYWVFKLLLTPVMAVAFRPTVEGIHHVPRRGGALLACNHTSYLDWLLLPLVVRFRRISFLAKLEYFTRGGVRGRAQAYFFTTTGQVPVDRAGAGAAAGALRTATRLLGEGRLVGVFPEGTRTRDGRLNRGRTGVARMAAASGAPVVPCATVGVFDVCPPGARVPRPRRIAVRFGEPMPPVCPAGREPSAEELRSWTDDLMARIAVLSGQESSGVDAVGRR